MSCPFCSSADVELISPWGGQMITSQMRCRACNTYFEAIRDPGESGSRAEGDLYSERRIGSTPPV
jgi:hypothetical protein